MDHPDLPVPLPQAEALMRRAIACAGEGIAAGQSPFAALIARLGEDPASPQVLGLDHNRVWELRDPTAHAELGLIRDTARRLRQIDFSGCWLWSTCEPCPMCMAAIHWARFDGVVFGATIADAAAAGFHELRLPAQTLLDLGGSQVRLVPALLSQECRQLFAAWKQTAKNPAY